MKKEVQKKYENGITLVALIITIIILIILAVISIKAVLNMNFIDLASNAVLNYSEVQVAEEKNMNDINSFLQSTIKKIENNDFNTGEGDNPTPTIEPTPEPGKNPGGVITDIVTEDIIIPGENSNLIGDKVGKTIDYEYISRSIHLSDFEEYCTITNTDKIISPWVVYAEDEEYLYIMRTSDVYFLGQE